MKLRDRLCVVFVALVLSCVNGTYALAQDHPPYKMLDSGFPAEDAFPTVWIDNHRVMFTGVELGKRAQTVNQPNYYRGLKNAAFVWNVRDGSVTKFRDHIISSFCSTGTYVSYRDAELVGKKVVPVVFAGKFGEEKRIGLASEHRYFNPTSCHYYAKPPAWLRKFNEERLTVPLLDEHGYVVYESHASGADAMLRAPHAKHPIPLQLDPKYGPIRRFAYLPYRDAYLGKADRGNSEEITPAFLLRPSGEVERIEVPDGFWRSPTYYGSREGLFIRSLWRSRQFPTAFGGYLLARGEVKKVVSGWMHGVSVSPDGCRIAFIYAASLDGLSEGYREWKLGKPGNTIRTIDVCIERSK